MKKYCLIAVLAIALPAQVGLADKCGLGWKIWATTSAFGVVAGSILLGISTYPNGDFNQQQSCEESKTALCCPNSENPPTGCTAQSSSSGCPTGQSLYCQDSAGTTPAPWTLQPWAKTVQIIGAVALPVSAASLGISLIAGCIIIAFH